MADGDVACPFAYPDLATAVRAAQQAGEEPVRQAIAESLAPYRTPTGGYHQRNVFRYVVAAA